MHFKERNTLGGDFDGKDGEKPHPPPSLFGRYVSWIMGRKPEEGFEPHWEMFGRPCLGKHNKHHKKHHKHHKHHHDYVEPERGPLGFAKAKGFVFGEGVGFGFT